MLDVKTKTFEASSRWIKRHARPLEAARWAYEFEGGTKDEVLEHLMAFQNEDGGFGHGLEPDFWVPNSNAMSTWAAGQMLIDLDVRSDHDMVQSMISYLINTYDQDLGMWASVILENNDYPHAPWWGYSEDAQNNWMFNPSAELAAFLIHWSNENDEGWQVGWDSLAKACKRLMSTNEMDFHEISNFNQMVKLLRSNQAQFTEQIGYTFEEISRKVNSLIFQVVEQDPAKWGISYQPFPLDFVKSPNNTLAKEFGALIEKNLDFFIENLIDEGFWDISWEWGQYPNEFAISRRYWQGILTVDRYKLLKRFGRV